MKLVVASVLYNADTRSVTRLVQATAVAAADVRRAGEADSVALILGDCGSPLLDQRAVPRPDGVALSITYHDLGQNLGHSGGCNEVVRMTTGLEDADTLFFLNPDALLEERALTHLVRVLAHSGAGVVDARQVPFEHPKAFDPTTFEQSWASGACLGIRAGLFRDVGGFDADHFWSYCNDVDLSWRVRLTGRRALHVPEAMVFHDKRVDVRGHLVATPTQDYFTTLGRLNLASRYGRPDVVARTARWIERHGSGSHREALAEYRARALRGEVPGVLPGAESVAQFVGGEYAPHRFQ